MWTCTDSRRGKWSWTFQVRDTFYPLYRPRPGAYTYGSKCKEFSGCLVGRKLLGSMVSPRGKFSIYWSLKMVHLSINDKTRLFAIDFILPTCVPVCPVKHLTGVTKGYKFLDLSLLNSDTWWHGRDPLQRMSGSFRLRGLIINDNLRPRYHEDLVIFNDYF